MAMLYMIYLALMPYLSLIQLQVIKQLNTTINNSKMYIIHDEVGSYSDFEILATIEIITLRIANVT